MLQHPTLTFTPHLLTLQEDACYIHDNRLAIADCEEIPSGIS